MIKNKNVNILIISFLLIAVMAVMLIFFLNKVKEDFSENITVSADGVTEETLSVRDLKLVPAESKEYSVNLVCEASGNFCIYLNCEEKEDGGMKPFVEVTVKANGEAVYEGTLAELIDSGKTVEFEGELKSTEPLVVTIVYEMPREIGNEAQGTYSDFDIHLKIEKS